MSPSAYSLSVDKNRPWQLLQALGVCVSRPPPTSEPIFLDGTVMLDVCFYFFVFFCPFLIHAASLAVMQIRSTAALFDQMLGRQRHSRLPVVRVSWRVAAPGTRQRQRTDVEEGEAGHCRTYVGRRLGLREMESGKEWKA